MTSTNADLVRCHRTIRVHNACTDGVTWTQPDMSMCEAARNAWKTSTCKDSRQASSYLCPPLKLLGTMSQLPALVTCQRQRSGFAVILVVVNRLTQMRHIMLRKDESVAHSTTVYQHDGMPLRSTTATGPEYMNRFNAGLCNLVGIMQMQLRCLSPSVRWSA